MASQPTKSVCQGIPQKWYVNNYVQMEFYRAFLMECIEVYFESADPSYRTFGEVFNVYAEGFREATKDCYTCRSGLVIHHQVESGGQVEEFSVERCPELGAQGRRIELGDRGQGPDQDADEKSDHAPV